MHMQTWLKNWSLDIISNIMYALFPLRKEIFFRIDVSFYRFWKISKRSYKPSNIEKRYFFKLQ